MSKSLSEIFSSDFEEKVVQAIIVDNHFAEQILEVVDIDLLDLKYTKKICELVINHYKKYNAFPSVSLLKSMCDAEVDNSILKKECLSYMERLENNPLNGDSGYVKDKSLMFFRTQAVKNALINDVVPKLEEENLDEILPVIQQAINKGSSRDVGYEYDLDEEERFVDNEFEKVPTRWRILNEVFHGGLGQKRLTTLIGSAGAGKSHFLINVGAGALLSKKENGIGRVVVHYTLELDKIEVARRYDACITGVPINDVPANKDKVLFSVKAKLPEGSKLIIKEYPMKTATVDTIKSHLSRLRVRGIVPDIIIIDYGDLLAPTESHSEARFNTSSIWISMKTLAQQLNIPVVTATQSNRAGYNVEVLTLDLVSEDFQKIMHSDIVVTMARNLEQKAAGIGKMLVGKNRQGRDGMIYAYSLDTARTNIDVFEITADVEQKIEKEVQSAVARKNVSELEGLEQFLKKRKPLGDN
jgi:replicative DNA helicase